MWSHDKIRVTHASAISDPVTSPGLTSLQRMAPLRPSLHHIRVLCSCPRLLVSSALLERVRAVPSDVDK